MIPIAKPLIFAACCAQLLAAVAIPKADASRAVNLEHYLKYRTENKVNLTCKETADAFTCKSPEQSFIENDGNSTTATAFKSASLLFNAALAPALQKDVFGAAMKELEEAETLRRQRIASKKPYIAPPSSPLHDALDRALVGNLEQIHIDKLDVNSTHPKTHISVEKVSYVNAMKRTAKDAAFSERILGDLRLEYTNAVVDTNDTDSFYKELPNMLEAWFDTNNSERSDYVGKQLATLYATTIRSPFSGVFTLKTKYLGNDAIHLDIAAESSNKKDARGTFAFAGVLQNASTLFTPARKPLTPGTPDFLFESLHAFNSADATAYRTLLKTDKRFSRYIGEYDTLLRSYFDKKIKKFAYSAVLSNWFSQAKTAVSKNILGKADSFEVTVKNRNGMTAMQVFGMVMGQLMAMPPQSGAPAPDNEKVLADTAAQNLEVKIEAH